MNFTKSGSGSHFLRYSSGWASARKRSPKNGPNARGRAKLFSLSVRLSNLDPLGPVLGPAGLVTVVVGPALLLSDSFRVFVLLMLSSALGVLWGVQKSRAEPQSHNTFV